MNKKLLVLGCSKTKKETPGLLPAIDRYDGSPYRVLRKYLRECEWPSNLSVAVLSAKHGLVGGFTGIENYDERMTPVRASEWEPQCKLTLKSWAINHNSMHFSLGKDYLPAVESTIEYDLKGKAEVFQGPIGMKLNKIKMLLQRTGSPSRHRPKLPEPGSGNVTYFLPDWDDLLDENFDFEADKFSGLSRQTREDKHCCVLMKPKRLCDGVLVSLAQHVTSKGPLRRIMGTEDNSLAPMNMRSQFGLASDQWLFGDCGAFSYVDQEQPTITVNQAVALYELHGFDFGASVDHMPVRVMNKDGRKRILSPEERQARVNITRTNAELFIRAAKDRKVRFNPVGTIQALSSEAHAETVHHYYDLGYRHIAIGGLVPRSDSEIESVVRAVIAAADQLKERPWIHLFGIFRPKLQNLFRELKIDSFDSATYFRKAWLRSDQNYLGTNGKWYAAIRVPMTSDGRTQKRLKEAKIDIKQLEREEREVLRLLCLYNKDQANISEVLDAVLSYDQHLTRSSELQSMRESYRRTLEDRPWRMCKCPFCQSIGIHVLIFRGANRNKRRGTHNTLMLYGAVKGAI